MNPELKTLEIGDILEMIQSQGIDHARWQSDIYIPVNAKTKSMIENYRWRMNVKTFVNRLDQRLWYEIPFIAMP